MQKNVVRQAVTAPRLTGFREEHEVAVYNSLVGNLVDHTDANDGFTLLEHQPDQEGFDFQRLDCVGMRGKNAGPEELRELAAIVYPATERIIDGYAKRKDLLNHAAHLLLDGKEVGVVTDHYESVIGIAVGGGSFLCALYENTPVEPEDIDVDIFISYMIKYTMLQGFMPTAHVLGDIFNRTTYTLPPSMSIREKVPHEVREAVNEESKKNYYNELADAELLPPDEEPIDDVDDEGEVQLPKGRLTMLAGSGSRDITTSRRIIGGHPVPRTTHMGPMADGTIEIVQQMYVLPVGVDLTSKTRPKVYVGEIAPEKPKDDIQAHAIMNGIATGMQRITRHPRRYHPSRESFGDAVKPRRFSKNREETKA